MKLYIVKLACICNRYNQGYAHILVYAICGYCPIKPVDIRNISQVQMHLISKRFVNYTEWREGYVRFKIIKRSHCNTLIIT